MSAPCHAGSRRSYGQLLVGWILLGLVARAYGAGVTIVTHGFNGNVTDWIIPMTEAMARHASFPGTQYSCYQLTVTKDAQSQFVVTPTFLGGSPPLLTDSGEILIKLDWSQLAGAFQASSTDIASAVTPALMSAGFLSDLGGRPLASLPVHLVGHSRGGSVISEIARLLGANGIWVDHVTTLDPRPVSGFGDAAVRTYANVLFADNYWQNLGDGLFVPNGMAISGAYNRQLTNLNGGYSSSHSDVHLWYHGTIDWAVPITDTQANLTATERANWWTVAEDAGHATGFRHSLIGGGNRLSSAEPAGAGNGRISDGFNRNWDLGGGIAANRTALPANNGGWPNLIRFNLTTTNRVPVGEPFPARFYVQYGQSGWSNATISFSLDADFNPFNGNETQLGESTVAGTGTNSVASGLVELIANPTNTPPGSYVVLARISADGRNRYLYAPERMVLTPSLQPPVWDPSTLRITGDQVRFSLRGFTGQQVVTQASTNLSDWIAVATNAFAGPMLEIVTGDVAAFNHQFFRTVFAPATP